MKEIVLSAFYGDEIKKVRITMPFGGGGSSYNLIVNNYYCGAINKMSDGWRVYFNSNEYTAADEVALLDYLRDLGAI